jgi:hypothetical protein
MATGRATQLLLGQGASPTSSLERQSVCTHSISHHQEQTRVQGSSNSMAGLRVWQQQRRLMAWMGCMVLAALLLLVRAWQLQHPCRLQVVVLWWEFQRLLECHR